MTLFSIRGIAGVVVFTILCLNSSGVADGLHQGISGHGGGAAPAGVSISSEEYQMVAKSMLVLPAGYFSKSRNSVMFADPIGGGGVNSPGKATNNYVDLDPTAGLLDYNCQNSTYDGHQGTDIDITSFYRHGRDGGSHPGSC